jgi:uncharacterized membrane protein YccC
MPPPVFRRLLRVPETAAVRSGRRLLTWQRHPAPGQDGRPGWLPVWSVPAWIRALRAAVVVPSLFALTFNVIGDAQMALFAVFGSFATLVMASFGGSWRDKVVAHLGLAVTGSVALVIGTVVSGTAWLAVIVTFPVTFGIFFAGVAGPNAASGVTAALLAYVLPVASAGGVGTVPSRLAGWWLASAISTAAVLLLSPRGLGDRLRTAAAAAAAAVAAYLEAGVRGDATPGLRQACTDAKHELMSVFSAAPYRPTGLATADQARASVVQLLEWCTAVVSDALEDDPDWRQAAPADRELLAAAAGVLRDMAAMLDGRDASPDLQRLERSRAASAAYQRELSGDPGGSDAEARRAVHAQTIALAVRAAAADAMIATRRADPETVAAERRRWYGGRQQRSPAPRRFPSLAGAIGLAAPHASLRSVWFRSSARGAAALAVAVAVADLSSVQHGFWVVLGTLSVLRSNAVATGSTVLRALLGTAAGFVVGATLLLAIGTNPTALWVTLPIAVLVASYTPGTAPFAVGQAAFTVTVLVLFNLLAPAGWQVGLLRVEDVALGCAVSLVIGALFWPRGAAAVVGDDLADAFRRGAVYLTQAVTWVLGPRGQPPDTAVAAVTAGIRLDEAIRGYLAEQGAKRVTKEDLWSLVMATTRLRLTAHSLASLRGPGPRADPAGPAVGDGHPGQVHDTLRRLTAELAGFYDRVAVEVGPPGRGTTGPPTDPAIDDPDWQRLLASTDPAAHSGPHALWVRDHLQHLGAQVQAITAPAMRLAEQRRIPWWR